MGIVKGLLFLGFVAFGLLAAWASARAVRPRRFINAFLVYTFLLGFGAGLSQHEVWPFSTWPLIAGTVPPSVTHPRLLAVDAEGREHSIDYRAFGPLVLDELIAWTDLRFLRLDDAAKDRVAVYLLGIVEANRRRWIEGKSADHFTRYFGPLSAPFFLGHPEYWTQGGGPPSGPLRGLRLYRETWNIEERWRDPSKVIRQLVYEYSAP